MAFRCQQSNTMQCPLCGMTDGGEYASMERMYTDRQNNTGRIMLRAVSKGNMGTDLVMHGRFGLSREMRECVAYSSLAANASK